MNQKIQEVIINLSDLHGKMTGNQDACIQLVAAQSKLRLLLNKKQVQEKAILEDYRNDVLCQLGRQAELMDSTLMEMPDSELFSIWAAAQMFCTATRNYFDLRNMVGVSNITIED